MAKLFNKPFAWDGDTEPLPDDKQISGKLSLAEGWSERYETPQDDPDYLPVDRREMNGLIRTVTESLGEMQVNGFAKWQSVPGGYPLGAIVLDSTGQLWQSVTDENETEPSFENYYQNLDDDIENTWVALVLVRYDEHNNYIGNPPAPEELYAKSSLSVIMGPGAGGSDSSFATLVGPHAGRNIAAGARSVAVGYRTLATEDDADSLARFNCVAVGAFALGAPTAPIQNTIGIGYQAGYGTDKSNTIYLGNASIENIYAQTNITTPSDIRDKTDIESCPLGLDFVEHIQPIQYRFNKNRNEGQGVPVGKVRLGFSAQEIYQHQESAEIVRHNAKADQYQLDAAELIAVLTQAIKDLSGQVKALQHRLDNIDNQGQ